MIMDGLDALSRVALADIHSFCYDTPSLSEAGSILGTRTVSESLDDTLNTPVTTCSDETFFGPDSLEPPPITATGRFLIYSFISKTPCPQSAVRDNLFLTELH